MKSKEYTLLEMERQHGLGREFSDKHPDFKFLAHLGNEYSRKRAALEFMKWLKDNPKVNLWEKLKKTVELLGEAEFLTLAKAWERMTMALGDTTPSKDYKKGKKANG